MEPILDVPMLADQLQQRDRRGAAGQAAKEVAHLVADTTGGVRRPAHRRLDLQHEAHFGPPHFLQIGSQDRRSAHPPVLQPPAVLGDRRCCQEALAGWRVAEQERHVVEQVGLVGLDGNQIVGARIPQALAQRFLALERIPAHQSTA